ncbi:Gfo/Idh/MocA family oxidoreductase [Brevibacillus ginsengisoli]|uniref:Gfo/Idh/MocA family oxidoreductase n=1 Tax=Brevibacillus ginsengisoli TaxID=363854 RepID=UPI003CFADEA9
MPPINVGVVGLGKMGENHCRILQMIHDVNQIAIYDIDLAKLQEIETRYNAKAYSTYTEMIDNVDAVIIATPTPLHFFYAKIALEKGKHVLVEKPITVTVEEATELQKSIVQASQVFQVGHVERFNPAIRPLKDICKPANMISIDAKRLSHSDRNLDTDVILDLMIHDIDIVLHLVKSPLHTVTATGVSLTNSKFIDSASALLSFTNGVIATLVASRVSMKKTRSLSIYETDRTISVNYLTKELLIYHQPTPQVDHNIKTETLIEKILIPQSDPLYEELLHFISCITKSNRPQIGPEEGLEALAVALKIKEAIHAKK